MDDAALARLENANMIATMSAGIANPPGSLVRERDGVVLMVSGLPARFFNQVVIEDDRAAPEAVAAAVAEMRERGAPFLVHLRRASDDRFRPLLTELGLVLPADQIPMPGIVLHPIPTSTTPVPPGHEIRRVDDATGMDDHVVTGARGFGTPEEMLRAIAAPDTWQRPGKRRVRRLNGRRAGGHRARVPDRRHDRCLRSSSRMPGARLGAAMTERIAADGAADGCMVAVIQSSPMGQQVYERLGYRMVVEYNGWIDSAPDRE
jgi:hypothetical protein